MDAPVLQSGLSCCTVYVIGNALLRQPPTVAIAEAPRRSQVPRYLQGSGKPHRQRHIAQLPSFRDLDVALPHRALDTELALLYVKVRPLQSGDLTASKTSVTTQQNHETHLGCVPSPLREPLEVLEVMERCRRRRDRQQTESAWHPLKFPPLDSLLSIVFNTVSTLFTVFGALAVSDALSCWTSSVEMLSSRMSPNRERVPCAG
jgi:hypothetical protein